MRRQSAFEIYLRTGRLVAEPELVEVKFNPWHDPKNGQFTFAGQGAYSGGGAASSPEKLLQGFKQYMKPEEGDRNYVYPDNLGIPTVGIGHKVVPADKLKLGDKISDARKEAFWRQDGGKALTAALRQMREAGITDPKFIFPLASVNFQLGTEWTKDFKKTWALIQKGDYKAAAHEVQRSEWYGQTKDRVEVFQKALRALPPRSASKKQ